MIIIKWTDQFDVGVRIFNKEHKKLIGIILLYKLKEKLGLFISGQMLLLFGITRD